MRHGELIRSFPKPTKPQVAGWPFTDVLTVDADFTNKKVDYHSLVTAVAAATAGQVIFLNPGTYTLTSKLVINKAIKLFAIPGTVTITLATSATSTISVENGGGGAEFEGLTIENTASGAAAACIATSQSITLRTVTLTKTGAATVGYGLWVFTNAVTVDVNNTDISVSGPTTGHGVRVDSGATVNIHEGGISGNTNDVSINHASGTIDLDDPTLTNDGVDISNGSITGWYYNGSGDHKNAEDGGGDTFPRGAGHGISNRFVEVGITPTDHFRSGSIPSGYSWQGGAFATPGTIFYSYLNDWLRCYHAGASRGFLAKSGDLRNNFLYIRIAPDTVTDGGLRTDDGTDNNYYEWRVVHSSGPSFTLRLRQRTGGGSATNTDTTIYPVDKSLILMLYLLGSPTHTPYCYLVNEVGQNINIAVGAAVSWTPSRVGIVVDGTGALNADWFRIP